MSEYQIGKDFEKLRAEMALNLRQIFERFKEYEKRIQTLELANSELHKKQAQMEKRT